MRSPFLNKAYQKIESLDLDYLKELEIKRILVDYGGDVRMDATIDAIKILGN